MDEQVLIIKVAIRTALVTILVGMLVESFFKPSWQTVYILIVLSYVVDMYMKN
jgi:uncharacterized membrane protein